MIYIDPEGNYPRYYGDIMLAHEGWQKGNALPEGWSLVTETDRPTPELYEVVEQGEPELRDGKYHQTWLKRPMTQHEIDIIEAPTKARQKLIDLGFTELEIKAISQGL